jgi:hypothetical protein
MSDFIDQVAQVISDAHDALPDCPDCPWNDPDATPDDAFDGENWDWNHHADAVLNMPEMQAIKRLLRVQAEAASLATRDTWNDSPADVLDCQGIPKSVIAWVLDSEIRQQACPTCDGDGWVAVPAHHCDGGWCNEQCGQPIQAACPACRTTR